MKFQALIVACFLGIFTSLASAQEEILLSEDFEGGLGAWTVDNSDNGLWHISEDGECLSETRMGAYNNGPAVCDYVTGSTGNSGLLSSPSVMLTGLAPHIISLNYIRSVGASDNSCVFILVVAEGGIVSIECLPDNSGNIQSADVSIPSGLENQEIKVQFAFAADSTDNNHPGFYVDNIVVKNSGPIPGMLPVTTVPIGSRYIAVTPSDHPDEIAISVVSPPEPATPVLAKYVQANGTLADTPVLQTPAQWGTVYVHGPEIVPDTEYEWRAEMLVPPNESPPVQAATWVWGDVNQSGATDLDDILCLLSAFAGDFSGCTLYASDLMPCTPDMSITIDDVLGILQAFAGNYNCP